MSLNYKDKKNNLSLNIKKVNRRITMIQIHDIEQKRPQFPEPFWREMDFPQFDQLKENIKVDVTIVGGGITGLTSAYLLVKEGFTVALIEADRILNGTTGHTTAKITAQHDLIYDQLITNFGKEKAEKYYKSNQEALDFIRKTINEQQIDCDFSEEDAYIYATTETFKNKIEKEASAYHQLKINGEYNHKIPFDFPVTASLVMNNQAQFHPLKYLIFLTNEIKEHGGLIFEHTTAIDVEEGKKPLVVTKNQKKITCDFVICASHFPFFDGLGFYFARMHAERSYLLGIKAKKDYPGGMYLSADSPKRSLRSTTLNGEKLVIVGAENHKTGQGINTIKHYEKIEAFANEQLGIKEYLYRWSAQDLYTLDQVPYIGEHSTRHPNILVATGYKKWGMTSGTTAALLLRDIILNKENPYKDLYTPSRLHINPDVKNAVIQNVDVASHLIAGKVNIINKNINDLKEDEGAVVTINAKRKGAYKDHEGKLHIVDTTCSHMGCEVEWNSGERTWDCPCHGSRYSIEGDVIEGPAKNALKQIEPKTSS